MESKFDESYEKLQNFINELKKENEELRTQLDRMYNLDDVAVDCRDNEIAFTSATMYQGNMVHMIVFKGISEAYKKGFQIILTEEQWERIVS